MHDSDVMIGGKRALFGGYDDIGIADAKLSPEEGWKDINISRHRRHIVSVVIIVAVIVVDAMIVTTGMKKHVNHMKEGQNDIYYITSESHMIDAAICIVRCLLLLPLRRHACMSKHDMNR